eukprot:scaffold81594_cov61-Attheya_sp.AAC.4
MKSRMNKTWCTVSKGPTLEPTTAEHRPPANPPTAEEIDEERGSLFSIHENGRLFGDADNASKVDEDEIEIQFDIEAQDDGKVLKDPEIIPEGLGYDDIGIITYNMLDIVVPHRHSKLIDLLSQFSSPRYAFKAILDLMKESCIKDFDFLAQHPTLDIVMLNNLRKSFPAVPQPKQTIVSLERDDFGEDMNPLLRTALER